MQSRREPNQMTKHSAFHSKGRLLALPLISHKGVFLTNTLAYYSGLEIPRLHYFGYSTLMVDSWLCALTSHKSVLF